MRPQPGGGFASVRDITRINCFLKKAKKMKFYPLDGLTIEELWRQSDDKLFKSITTNDKHVLYKFLPEVKNTGHNLRKRVHPYNLPDKDDRNFFNRLLYLGIVWTFFIYCILFCVYVTILRFVRMENNKRIIMIMNPHSQIQSSGERSLPDSYSHDT